MNTHTVSQHDSTKAIKTAKLKWQKQTIKLILRVKRAPQQHVKRSNLTSVQDAPFSRRLEVYYTITLCFVWIERMSWKQLLFFFLLNQSQGSCPWCEIYSTTVSKAFKSYRPLIVAPPFLHTTHFATPSYGWWLRIRLANRSAIALRFGIDQ